MKDWVLPFLVKDKKRRKVIQDLLMAGDIPPEVKKMGSDESVIEEIAKIRTQGIKEIHLLLTLCLPNCKVGFDPESVLPDESDPRPFAEVFGSVLADLPEKVFKKIRSMTNLFFFSIPPNMGMHLGIKLTKPLKKEMHVVLLNEATSWVFPRLAVRALIAHEIAHAFRRDGLVRPPDKESKQRMETQADRLLKDWEFTKEIESLGKLKGMKPEEIKAWRDQENAESERR